MRATKIKNGKQSAHIEITYFAIIYGERGKHMKRPGRMNKQNVTRKKDDKHLFLVYYFVRS